MFSLIITIISVALVAALALATLYYGGDAYESGQAKSEAAKLRNQGQQLVAAAEFYYLQKGQWPETIDKMVEDGYLTTVPVAQRTAIQEALAGKAWVMPVARQPLFTFDEITPEVCSTVNQDSYGLKGILPKLQAGYMQQCFGPSKNDLLMVVGRGSLPDLVAAVNEGLLVPENVSSDPIPDPSDTTAWTLPPVEDAEPSPLPDPGAEPGELTSSPSALSFGAVPTHTTSTQAVLISNEGSRLLSLEAPRLTGGNEFLVDSTSCGSSLTAGASCEVVVAYSPTVPAAQQTALLTLTEGLTVSVTASSYNPVSLQSATLPVGKLNRAYTPVSFSDYFLASNEGTPDLGQVAWDIQGSLPSGLTFDAQTGVLSGTPTALTETVGQDFTVTATYKNNQGQQVYTIRVGDAVLNVIQVSAGKYFTCAVTSEGAAKCWGVGDKGQLGNGSLVSHSLVPTTVQGLEANVTQVSTGYEHACALLSSGAVQCWGAGPFGQLGHGLAPASQSVPVTVQGLSEGAAELALGGYTSCALTRLGTVKCWGADTAGQLGDDAERVAKSTAVPVVGLPAGIRQIAASGNHACALTPSSTLYCWGHNSNGQLGNGNTNEYRATPIYANYVGATVRQVSVGSGNTCIVTTQGGARCWGYNANGELGDGSTLNRTSPVDVSSLTSGVLKVSIGGGFACALLDSGGVSCWGGNYYGQLGAGHAAPSYVPISVVGLNGGAQDISTSYTHVCASTTSGLKCWGSNVSGELGDGTQTNRTAPVSVLD